MRQKKNQSMIILLAIGPWSIDLCLIASFYAERDRFCRHYDFCDFANWSPFDMKTVLLRIWLILIFRKEFSRMRLPIKCLRNDANKICFTFTALRKIDKANCMHFFFSRVYYIYDFRKYVHICFSFFFFLFCLAFIC